MKRGFTLLEMVLALVLLSGLMLAMGRWMQGVRQLEESTRGDDWYVYADRVLEAIRLDLRLSDRPADPQRVQVQSNGWSIRGRHGEWRRYLFDAELGVLRLEGEPTALIGDLNAAELRIEVDTGLVTAELIGSGGREAKLEVRL